MEIYKTMAALCLQFLYITTPQLSLVYEQYAIISLKPTINSNFRVLPRINPLWGNNFDNAISVVGKFLILKVLKVIIDF